MRRHLEILALCSVLTTAVSSQEWIGFSHNVAVSFSGRLALMYRAGHLFTRIDGDEYAGWGGAGAYPGYRAIRSIAVTYEDLDASTPEPLDVFVWPEDPSNPGYPDMTAPTFVESVMQPQGQGHAVFTHATSSPVLVPLQGGDDVFVSFHLPYNSRWPCCDGLSVHVVVGSYSGLGVSYDAPGNAQQPNTGPGVSGSPANSHVLVRIDSGTLAYMPGMALKFDVMHDGPGGVVLAITDQPNYPSSNDPPPFGWVLPAGTASFHSGVSPDVVYRGDRVSFRYHRSGSGTPLVFFLYDIGGFGPETPLSAYIPAGVGVLCVGSATAIPAGLGTALPDGACRVVNFPGVGPWLHGVALVQQAIEWDPIVQIAYASPCGRQVF